MLPVQAGPEDAEVLVLGDGDVGWTCSSMCAALDMPVGAQTALSRPTAARSGRVRVPSARCCVLTAQPVVKEGDH